MVVLKYQPPITVDFPKSPTMHSVSSLAQNPNLVAKSLATKFGFVPDWLAGTYMMG